MSLPFSKEKNKIGIHLELNKFQLVPAKRIKNNSSMAQSPSMAPNLDKQLRRNH